MKRLKKLFYKIFTILDIFHSIHDSIKFNKEKDVRKSCKEKSDCLKGQRCEKRGRKRKICSEDPFQCKNLSYALV